MFPLKMDANRNYQYICKILLLDIPTLKMAAEYLDVNIFNSIFVMQGYATKSE